MKKSTLIYLSIISILFTAVLYLLFLNFNKSPSLSESTTPTYSDSPTADWQKYTNSIYNFTLEYPSKYVIYHDGITANERYLLKLYTEKQNFVFLEISKSECYKLENSGPYQNIQSENIRQIKIAGYESTVVERNGAYDRRYLKACFNKDGYSYFFDTDFEQNSPDSVDIIKEFDNILSTFKFINPTADWKTYENKQYGLSFKYPKSYISTYEDVRKMDETYITTIHSPDYKINQDELPNTSGEAFFYVHFETKQCLDPEKKLSLNPALTQIRTKSSFDYAVYEINDEYSPFSSRFASLNSSSTNTCFTIYCNSSKQNCDENYLGKELILMLFSSEGR